MKVKLYKGALTILARSSPNTLYSEDLVLFDSQTIDRMQKISKNTTASRQRCTGKLWIRSKFEVLALCLLFSFLGEQVIFLFLVCFWTSSEFLFVLYTGFQNQTIEHRSNPQSFYPYFQTSSETKCLNYDLKYLGLTHLRYKIKHNKRCSQLQVLDSQRFKAIDFSFQPRKS